MLSIAAPSAALKIVTTSAAVTMAWIESPADVADPGVAKQGSPTVNPDNAAVVVALAPFGTPVTTTVTTEDAIAQ